MGQGPGWLQVHRVTNKVGRFLRFMSLHGKFDRSSHFTFDSPHLDSGQTRVFLVPLPSKSDFPFLKGWKVKGDADPHLPAEGHLSGTLLQSRLSRLRASDWNGTFIVRPKRAWLDAVSIPSLCDLFPKLIRSCLGLWAALVDRADTCGWKCLPRSMNVLLRSTISLSLGGLNRDPYY